MLSGPLAGYTRTCGIEPAGEKQEVVEEKQEVVECNQQLEDSQGVIREHWKFDEDAYMLCLTALVRKGLAKSTTELLIALITPVLTLLACRVLLEYLLAGKEGSEEDDRDNLQVQIICFFLAGLSLSNEVHEGMIKIVFSLRAATGVYEGVDVGSMWIGVMLGSTQVFMSLIAMAINMQLVAQAETVLDCFLNFVAVGFLAEIDNLVMDSRTLKGFINDEGSELEVRRVHTETHGFKGWLLVMIGFNVGIIFGTLNSILINKWVGGVRDPPVTTDWLSMLPDGIIAAVVLNVVLLASSRLRRPINLIAPLAIAIQLFLSVWEHTGCVLARDIVFMFSIFGPAVATAVDHYPFEILWCPVRFPLIIWCLMYGAQRWMRQLHAEGVA